MKKDFLLFTAFASMLISCEEDASGDVSISPIFWVVLVVVIIILWAVGSNGEKQAKEIQGKLQQQGINNADFIDMGMYASGHPNLDKSIEGMKAVAKDGNLDLYEYPYQFKMPEKKAEIPIAAISNITVEDASTLERKITIGRMILVGVFAFAWRKKKKNEMAFVEIDWKSGKFDNETLFCFQGKDAMQKANTARNALIKVCS